MPATSLLIPDSPAHAAAREPSPCSSQYKRELRCSTNSFMGEPGCELQLSPAVCSCWAGYGPAETSCALMLGRLWAGSFVPIKLKKYILKNYIHKSKNLIIHKK